MAAAAVAALASPRLQNSGKAVMAMSAPASARGGASSSVLDKSIRDMSLAEMEKALQKYSKKRPDQNQLNNAPQTARALLEENKRLIEEKKARKALERKNSREFTESLLANDRSNNETDKARDIGRRQAQKELAQYYKAQIAKKQASKESEYQRKLDAGGDVAFFPFVEGENITKTRVEQCKIEAEEMRAFLARQLYDNPPRIDPLLQDVDTNYTHKYPHMPPGGGTKKRAKSSDARHVVDPQELKGSAGIVPESLIGDEVAPHMQRYPRFLSRAREHMSRRLHDEHVRKALEEKVLETKRRLESEATKRAVEMKQADDGTLVNDALRYDSGKAKADERLRNAEYLKKQMNEKKGKLQAEKQERERPGGYWGPDNKPSEDVAAQNKELCGDLITQMHVNQHRRLDSRCRRLRQERRLIDNCMAEMSQDRQRDRQKHQQHREVLVQTWESQQKIRKAMEKVELI
eukprot:TRINITY_DN111905_c0_g1_i1.p1 TRINITY_DN111905_c0_g1~~TRINITY_DN111905_c0_g1_i1.p1  ORF type:complete len:480 (+),score=152.95 TRINITY_DN111905_c0_g1_i1:53-1441(+)